MFWQRFYDLCVKMGTKPNPVGKIIGISSATITQWKQGSIPSGESLAKIADYLDCSVDYLLGRTDNLQAHTDSNGILGLSDEERRLIAVYRELNDEGKDKVLDTLSDMQQLDRYKKRTKAIYRAARSQDNAEEPEIIQDGESIIEKLSKITPVTDKEDF